MGTTEDKMVGWHHRLNRHDFEQTLGGSEGQESLESCSPRGHKESDVTQTEQQQHSFLSIDNHVIIYGQKLGRTHIHVRP